MKSISSIFPNLCVSIFSLTATALFCELSWRHLIKDHVTPTDSYTNEVFYYPKPYVGFTGKPGAKIGLGTDESFNSLGYRGELPKMPKPAAETRIFVYGGSTVLGHGSNIVDLLEEQLGHRGFSNVRVYNFGVVASVSGQALSRFIHEGMDLDPDMVIAYNGANDLQFSDDYDPRPGYPFNFMVAESNPIYHVRVEDYPLMTLALYGSQVLRDLAPNFFKARFADTSKVKQKIGLNDMELEEIRVEKFFQNMHKMKRIANSLGIEFLWVLQPFTIHKEKKVGAEVQFNDTSQIASAEKIRSMLLEKVEAKGGLDSFFDRTDFFDQTTEQIFYDDCHVLDEKKPLVASMLADIVLGEMKR